MQRISGAAPYGFFDKSEGVLVFFSDLTNFLQYVSAKSRAFIPGAKVADRACKYVGSNFAPGESNQCANFVRQVLRDLHCEPGVTKEPSDGIVDPIGPGYANSFAGNDIGLLLNRQQLQPGDIVLFQNTTEGWEPGTITHVGIYIGNDNFVHKPGKDLLVERTNLEVYKHFKEGRRIYLN